MKHSASLLCDVDTCEGSPKSSASSSIAIAVSSAYIGCASAQRSSSSSFSASVSSEHFSWPKARRRKPEGGSLDSPSTRRWNATASYSASGTPSSTSGSRSMRSLALSTRERSSSRSTPRPPICNSTPDAGLMRASSAAWRALKSARTAETWPMETRFAGFSRTCSGSDAVAGGCPRCRGRRVSTCTAYRPLSATNVRARPWRPLRSARPVRPSMRTRWLRSALGPSAAASRAARIRSARSSAFRKP